MAGKNLDIRSPTTKEYDLPSLCVGKNYHVFIASSSADSDFVLSLVNKLESDQYRLKVCHHERDFIPGITILKNIETAIRQSLKTIIVLSKHFRKSEWCMFEAESTVTFSVDSRQSKLLIPLLIDEAEVPCFLNHFGVIKATTKNPQWFQEVVEAIFELSHDKNLLLTPVLTTGKLYNVSFVCSDKQSDLKWVDNVISKLTTDPLKYRCHKWPKSVLIEDVNKVAIQDISNIVKTLEVSEKTVIVISKGFMNNKELCFMWHICKMVVQDLKLPGGSLIPVHVDGVQHGEGTITYLSASYDINDLWWNKFLEALVSPAIVPQPALFENHIEDLKIFRITDLYCKDDMHSKDYYWRPIDVTFASKTRFVLTEHCLELYSLSGQLLDAYKTGNYCASSLTRVREGYIAAAYRNLIQIFCCEDKLRVEKEIRTNNNRCLYGIASFDEESFIVSYRNTLKIDILSCDGSVLRTFQKYCGQTPLFRDSRFVNVTAKNAFVVDTINRRLVCFSRDGSFHASQKPFSTEYHIMRGIHCSEKRNYVLVDATIKTFEVEEHCNDNKIVFKPFLSNFVGTTYMRSIAVDPLESAFALICASDGKEMVRIFGMLPKRVIHKN